MRLRLVICSLAGPLILAGCLDRKTGSSDAATANVDVGVPASSDSSAADAKVLSILDVASGRQDVG